MFFAFKLLAEGVHGNRHESDVDDFAVVATDQLTVFTGGSVEENVMNDVGGEEKDGTVAQVGACADSLDAFGEVSVGQDRLELSGVFSCKKSEHAGGVAVNVATANGGDGVVEADDIVDRLRGESLLHVLGATCVGEAEGSLEFSCNSGRVGGSSDCGVLLFAPLVSELFVRDDEVVGANAVVSPDDELTVGGGVHGVGGGSA